MASPANERSAFILASDLKRAAFRRGIRADALRHRVNLE